MSRSRDFFSRIALGTHSREMSPSEYHGEWYTPSLSPEDYLHFRTREKWFSRIAALIYFALGILPSVGLNARYAAGCYLFALILLVYLMIQVQRGPKVLFPLTRDQHRAFGKTPRTLCTLARILVVSNIILDVIGTYHMQFDLTVWTVVQLILMLVTALILQFMHRMQRDLRYDISTEKPSL